MRASMRERELPPSYPCGHPRTPENTYQHVRSDDGKGEIARRCRECCIAYNSRRQRDRDRRRGVATNRWRSADKVECRLADYDFLVEIGEPFPAIARRFGLKEDSLRQWLYRNGRGWTHGDVDPVLSQYAKRRWAA